MVVVEDPAKGSIADISAGRILFGTMSEGSSGQILSKRLALEQLGLEKPETGPCRCERSLLSTYRAKGPLIDDRCIYSEDLLKQYHAS